MNSLPHCWRWLRHGARGIGPWISAITIAAASPLKETVTYKQAGDCAIQADVFHDGTARSRPAIVWIHGGGVINGHRESIPAQVREFAAANGYVLVSLDYRLAPESKLPDVVSDLEDAFRWLRGEGAARFGIDPDRIAVSGGSAGGFLTLIVGFRVEPAPRVLLSFWGYGEILGDWATKPSPHPRHHAKAISEEEFTRQLGGPPVSDSRQRQTDGGLIYLYGRQTGTWGHLIAGADPRREPEKVTPYLPLHHVSDAYPPAALIHGTADTDVPFEQSQLMAREFARHGVPFQLHAIANGEHGLGGGDPGEIAEAYRQAFDFVKRYLAPP